jgi:hypothetical protein
MAFPMTAPEQRSNGLDANARGIIVLVVAVVVGLLLLYKAGSGGGGGTTDVSTKKSGSTTTITIDDTGSTTSTTEKKSSGGHTPSEVKVLVLNGSGKTGVATSTSDSIKQTGYTMLTPDNATTNTATTTVYYADGYQTDAENVATVLGKTSDIVKPKPATSLGTGSDTANVVVVLGADVSPVGATTTTSGTGTGATTTTTG